MSAEIVNTNGGVVTARVSGTLTQKELTALQMSVGDIIQKQGVTRLLVLVENFNGWEAGATWGDFTFQLRHDASVERMAIVGDKTWKDLALLFTSQGLRPFPIEYFDTAQLVAARAWIGR